MSTTTPPPRSGYVWVEGADGTPPHWERERAQTEPPVDPPVEATPPPATPPAAPPVAEHTDDKPRRGKKHKKRDKDRDDDDDDNDRDDKHRGKKGKKKRDKDRDDDDDDNDNDRDDKHRGKKHKKRDKDRDDDESDDDHVEVTPTATTPPPATPPTAPPPPAQPPGPEPVVRDHRDPGSADAPGGVTVTPSGGRPTVRDHRGEPPPARPDTGPTVRDHRGEPPPARPDTGPTVRDHRGEPRPAPPSQEPEPVVRDHRVPDPNPMVAANLDEFSTPPPASAPPAGSPAGSPAADVRDHRDAPPPPENREAAVRDHRVPVPDDVVGDTVDVAPADVSSRLVDGVPVAAAAEFSTQVEAEDWDSPGTSADSAEAMHEFADDAFDASTVQPDDVDAFAQPEPDDTVSDVEMSEQLD